MFKLIDFLQRERNEGRYSCVAYLDLSKAFNCVNHHILLNKLKHYGIAGTCLKWFQSYLSNRRQFTVLNQIISGTAAVPSGVPQGSILGPILYLIYVNDIGGLDCKSNIIMFADDTALYYSGSDPSKVCKTVEKDLSIVSQYFAKLKLCLNKKKTKVMNFHKNYRKGVSNCFPSIRIGEYPIEVVPYFKYLGILIDTKLRLVGQLRNNLRNANSKLFLFRKIRPCLSQKNAIMVYKAMVLPFVEYSNALMLGCPQFELQKIQRTQNKGLRIALRRDRTCRTSILHSDARLADWKSRAMIALNKLMFKYKSDPEWIEGLKDRPRTRQNEGLVMCINKPRNNGYLNSVSYIGRSCWNKLPAEIRNSIDMVSFSRKVKKLHTEKYFGTTTESQ